MFFISYIKVIISIVRQCRQMSLLIRSYVPYYDIKLGVASDALLLDRFEVKLY
jgi:hypothetical protein